MALSILSSTNYEYSGQADSRSYTSASGTNTLLVVCVTGQAGGSGMTPTNRSVTYNGVAMTVQSGGDYIVSGSGAISTFSFIYTLVSPATGANTLTIDYSNGSGWGINVAVYTLGGVSNAPVSTTYFHGAPSYNNFNGQSDTITFTPTSSNELCIDCNGFTATADASQTKNGVKSSYKFITGTTQTSMIWSSGNFYPVGYCHSVLLVRENKDFSISDTVALGDSAEAVKGVLIKVADGIAMSESFSWVKNIFISVSDTLGFKDRGWFGTVDLFTNVSKSVTTWLNKNKS